MLVKARKWARLKNKLFGGVLGREAVLVKGRLVEIIRFSGWPATCWIFIFCRMQTKLWRTSPWSAPWNQWSMRHPPIRTQRSPFLQPKYCHKAERKPGRKLLNPPKPTRLWNPRRCPRPQRLQKSRKVERRKLRNSKSPRCLWRPPASQLLSPTQRTS